jgi:ribonuclease VapC
MFVDAAAIVAIIGDEPEADRCATAISAADKRITSPIAVWEAAVALARPEKSAQPVAVTSAMVGEFLQERSIEVRDFPPADVLVALTTDAAARFRAGRNRLNLADCFHYACARHYGVPILSTDDEFRFTDLETVP